MKTDLFQSCGHCWVFHSCWHIECSTFTVSPFRIWNSSTGIPSPPLALIVLPFKRSGLLVLYPWVQKEKQEALYPPSIKIHRGSAPGHTSTPQSGGTPTSQILHQELRPLPSDCTPNTWRVTPAYIQWTDHEGGGKWHRLMVSRGQKQADEGHIRVLPARVLQSESRFDQVEKREDLKYSMSSLGL